METAYTSDAHLIEDALRLLGVRRFALAIHDQSFPSVPDEDIGRGSPYSRGGLAFLRFARSLGFNAIQFGPQGKTTRYNPSPYDSTLFSRNVLSLAPLSLASGGRTAGIVAAQDLESLLTSATRQACATGRLRVNYALAWETAHCLLDRAYERFVRTRLESFEVGRCLNKFIAEQNAAAVNWLERDAIYEALTAAAGTDDWQQWGRGSALDRRLYAPRPGEEQACQRRIRHISTEGSYAMQRFAFGQYVLGLQHDALRAEARRLGMTLYGDMQVGFSHQDRWAWRSLFLRNYLLGAPPSRTNQHGQPWGYPVLHPHMLYKINQHGLMVAGPAMKLIEARTDKLFSEFDGLRIDHPQGFVCPWVYRADDPDPWHAVQHGARLYSSPNLPDHPELKEFALVEDAALNPDPEYPRYGDAHEQTLSPAAIERFAAVIDTMIRRAEVQGRTHGDILCEVLSTCPKPLKAVMQQRGLSRFCVTQKADPANPDDIYRGENTSPHDWIMVGSHDTPPLWRIAEEKKASPWMRERALLLGKRLVPDSRQRPDFIESAASDPVKFCEAMFAELFLGPAQNVSVFFTDLLGMHESYNEPGTVGDHNWSLRVPADYENIYVQRAERGEAFNVRRALALALTARAPDLGEEAQALARRLVHNRA